MKKKITALVLSLMLISINAFAESITYTVNSGDCLWLIASKYQAGISEILAENPSITNPSLIYPGQLISIPTLTAVKAQENEVVRLVNVERSKLGLMLVTQNWELSRVARYKSEDMLSHNYFAHQSPTYGSPFVMMENFGIHFSAAGENIAMGQRTPAEVMNAWMNSPGHRANILSPSYDQIGVGLAKNSNGSPYWTQQFIKTL